jgi:hypothetical protein
MGYDNERENRHRGGRLVEESVPEPVFTTNSTLARPEIKPDYSQ